MRTLSTEAIRRITGLHGLNGSNKTGLQTAIFLGDEEAVFYFGSKMIQAREDTREEVVSALETQNLGLIRALVKDARVDVVDIIANRQNGDSLFHVAARITAQISSRDVRQSMLMLFAERGCNTRKTNNLGETPRGLGGLGRLGSSNLVVETADDARRRLGLGLYASSTSRSSQAGSSSINRQVNRQIRIAQFAPVTRAARSTQTRNSRMKI